MEHSIIPSPSQGYGGGDLDIQVEFIEFRDQNPSPS